MSEFQANLRECPNCHARIPYYSTDARDCPAGTVLRNRYLIGKALGRGGFGVSYIAMDLGTRQRVCVKECNVKDRTYRDPYNPIVLLAKEDGESHEEFEKFKQSLLQEGESLVRLRGIPEVVHCLDSFEANNTAYVVMEYLEGRDLKHYVREERGTRNPLSIDEAVYYTILLLNALSKVHKHNILHRDISPDNIYLMNNGALKLIDFGSARKLSSGSMTGFHKPGYTAPEMLAGDKEGPYTDIYSAGAVLYFLLTGKKPEKPVDGGQLTPPPPERTTPELTAIFTKAVQRKPQSRYQSAEDMARELNAFLHKRSGASADSNTHTHTHTHTHTRSHTRTRTHTTTGKSKTGLIMGVMAAVMVLLIAVMIFASSGPQKPEPVVTAVPVTATPSPTPVITDEPAAVADEPAGPTVMPEETPTPTPTPSPTPEPAAELRHHLVTRPANAYTLLSGTYVDIPLSFNEKGAFDLALDYDQSKLRIDMPNGQTMRVTALAAGDITVSYTDGENQRTFMVFVVDVPQVHMLAEESDTRMFISTRDGFQLFLSKGDQVQLKVDGLSDYALQADAAAAQAGLTIARTEGGHLITVDALAEGEQTIAIRTGSLELFQLTVTVTPHAVTSDLQDAYSLYEGSVLPLTFTFSDGAAVDLAQDVSCSSDSLRITADSGNPNLLYLTAAKPGVADVIVSGQIIRVTVEDLPRLSGEGLKSNRSGNSYTLEVSEGTEVQLQMEGVAAQLPVTVSAAQGNAPAITMSGSTLTLSAQRAGSFQYDFTTGEQPLFTLHLTVNERGVATDFKPLYTMLAATKMSLPLAFSNNVSFTPAVSSSDESIVAASFAEQSILLQATGTGSATVTVDDKSFTVTVLPGATLTDIHHAGLEYRDGIYVLNMHDTQTARLSIQRAAQDYAITWEQTGDNACTLQQQGEELIISGASEGSATFVFRTQGLDADAELFILQVNVAFQPQLTNQFKDNYLLVADSALEIPLSFRDNQRYVPQVECSSRLIQVQASDTTLTLTALEQGSASFTVDGKRLAVTVLPRASLAQHEGVDLVQTAPGQYTLNISDADRFTLSLSDLTDRCEIEFVSADSNICSVSPSGNELNIEGHKEGHTSFAIRAKGADGEGELLRLDVNVGFAQQLTTQFKESYVLIKGTELTIPLSFRNDQRFVPALTCASQCLDAQVTDQALTLTAKTSGKAKVIVDGAAFQVTVQNPVTLAPDAPGLTHADVDAGLYTVSMLDTDTITLDLKNLSSHYDVVVERIGDDVCDASIDGKTLTITGKRAGSTDLIVHSQGADVDIPLFRISVNVTLKQQVTTTFKDAYTVLEGSSISIPLSFRGNERFVPAVWAADTSVAQITATEDAVTITGVNRGTSRMKVDGTPFAVNTLSRIYLMEEDLIRGDNNHYTLYLPQNTITFLNASNSKPGYKVEFSGSRTGERFLSINEYNVITVSTDSTSGEFTYTFYATNEDFTEELFTLTLIVSEPRLGTVFDFSYAMMLGETSAIPLTFENGRTEVQASSRTMDVSVQDDLLVLHASREGQHTVQVKAGSETQTFYVQVTQPTITLLMNGMPLEKDAEGSYLMTMQSFSEEQLEVQAHGCSTAPSFYADGFVEVSSAMNINGGVVSINTQEASDQDIIFHFYCEPWHHNMQNVGENIPLATLRLTVGMEWQISAERLQTLEDDPAQIMLDVCSALKTLELLKGNATLQAQRAIEMDGSLRNDIWQLMQQVKANNGGFSDESYYTYEDYQRLMSIAADFEAFQKAQAAATPTPQPQSQNAEKTYFSIVDAAASEKGVFLLDKDGYVIEYNRDLTDKFQILGEAKTFTEVAGNGDFAVLVKSNGSFTIAGNIPLDLAEEVDNNADQVSSVAMTPTSVLLVLGDDGIFSLEGDKKLDPKQEDNYLSAGQAFYVWQDGKNIKAMGVSVNKETTAAENILMTAAGGSTIAFMSEDDEGVQTIYAKSTAKKPGLGVSNLTQKGRVFAPVKATLPDKQPLDILHMSVSDDNLAVVQSDGSVYVMGANDRYQMGIGHAKAAKNFQQVLVRENRPLTNIRQALVMDGYVLMLDNDGYLWISGSPGIIYSYATRLNSPAGVASLVRLTDTQALLIDYNGQVLILDYDQPLNYDPTFITVQR